MAKYLASIRSTKDTHAKNVLQSKDLKTGKIFYFNKKKIKKTFSTFQNISLALPAEFQYQTLKK